MSSKSFVGSLMNLLPSFSLHSLISQQTSLIFYQTGKIHSTNLWIIFPLLFSKLKIILTFQLKNSHVLSLIYHWMLVSTNKLINFLHLSLILKLMYTLTNKLIDFLTHSLYLKTGENFNQPVGMLLHTQPPYT
jgi:hypothetical protein